MSTDIDMATQADLASLLALRNGAKQLPIYARKKARNQLLGGHLSGFRGRGMEFAEVRAYHAGDDIRYMDWRVTARSGTPHTKLYQEEREKPQFVVVDFNSSMYFATRGAFKSVIAAQLSALLGWSVVAHGDRIGAFLFAGDEHVEIRPSHREQGALRLVQELVAFQKKDQTLNNAESLAKALARVRHVAKPGSVIYIISDFNSLDALCQQHLSRLSRHNQVSLCWIRDHIEVTLPPPNYYPISDGNKIDVLNLMDANRRAAYSAYFEERKQRIEGACRQFKCPLLHFYTHDNIVEALPREFKKYLSGRDCV